MVACQYFPTNVDIASTTLGFCGLTKPDWMEGNDISHHRIDKPAAATAPDSVYLQNVIPTGTPTASILRIAAL